MANQLNHRESGIELLRILAAAGVVFSHFCNAGDIFDLPMGGGNYLLLTLIRSFTIASVDIFVMITGYFMCTSNKRTLGKPLFLLLQIIAYSIVLYLVFVLFRYQPWSVKSLIGKFIPVNWFITLYLVLYFLSPYLNIIIGRLNIKEFRTLLVVMLLFFSIWPMVMGVTSSFGFSFEGLSTVGRGGNNAGYTFINFVSLYLVGAYIRLNKMDEKVTAKRTLFISAMCGILLWGLRMLPIDSEPWHIAGWYDNILVILLAASLLVLFKKMKFKNTIINTISKAAFTVYIIHSSFIPLFDTYSIIREPLYIAIPLILLFIVMIYVIALILWKIFSLCTRKLQAKFDSVELINLSNI